jgi:hypothetical protein
MVAFPFFFRNRFRNLSFVLLMVTLFVIIVLMVTPAVAHAQSARPVDVQVTPDPAAHKISVKAGGKLFTELIYPEGSEKPVLYPIYAPDEQLITRGFPLKPRQGEPVDHPHHLGLWFNYENVNGLDFWNNSYAIPAEKKHSYGWIKIDNITKASNIKNKKEGDKGIIQYHANWIDQQKNVLLEENTTLLFSAAQDARIIDRTTTLTARQDISFPDAKDGMLGLRVTRELQIPTNTPGEFVDDKGNITKVAAGNAPEINGTYITSEGKMGDSAWGTRGTWCMLYGKKGQDTLSVLMIDHPKNPGYPTYWHARGYGLFAANPLGQRIFSKDKENMNFKLEKGKSVTFRYRIVVASGPDRLSTGRIRELTDVFTQPD